MSDTEKEKSAEAGTFDKETEKEKLREQLRREEENRRSTEHMSELLLQGATMTNRHCDVCGDPLFRYGGQEFCPTCSQEDGVEGEVNADPEAGEGARTAQRTTDADGDESESLGAAGIDRVAIGTATPDSESTTPDVGETRTPDAGATPTPTASETAPNAAGPRTTSPTGGDTSPQEGGDIPEDVAAARAALVRTLSSLAHRAESTDDVGRSRELLAAAREAAEALSAVDELWR